MHIEDMKKMFIHAADTRIGARPIKLQIDDLTSVVGVIEGTFAEPLPTGDGKSILPTGRAPVAHASSQIFSENIDLDPRLQSVVAPCEFTDALALLATLGASTLDGTEPLDLPYSAFTSLEWAGPAAECTDILRWVALDDTLRRDARWLLPIWSVQ